MGAACAAGGRGSGECVVTEGQRCAVAHRRSLTGGCLSCETKNPVRCHHDELQSKARCGVRRRARGSNVNRRMFNWRAQVPSSVARQAAWRVRRCPAFICTVHTARRGGSAYRKIYLLCWQLRPEASTGDCADGCAHIIRDVRRISSTCRELCFSCLVACLRGSGMLRGCRAARAAAAAMNVHVIRCVVFAMRLRRH